MNKFHKITTIPVLAAMLGIGTIAGTATLAFAQSSDTNGTTTGSITEAIKHMGPHQANGKTEEVLTGDLKTRAESAALAAVPGGTIERVETDADGGVYEAHMTDASGNRVTVIFDENFNVTDKHTGGPGRHGGRGPRPDDAATAPATSN